MSIIQENDSEKLTSTRYPRGTLLKDSDPDVFSEVDWDETVKLFPRLNSNNLTRSNNDKIAWKCSAGHRYYNDPNHRTSYKGAGCKVCKSLAYLYPKVAKRWSSDNTLSPWEVTSMDSKKAFWECSNGHKYSRRISHEVNFGALCPLCASLAFIHPQYIPLWSSNNTKTAWEVTPSSGLKAKWSCDNGHEYSRTVHDQVKNNTFCPSCNSVAFKLPHLVPEWSSKNVKAPWEVSSGTNKKYYFECSKGHSLFCTPYARNKSRDDDGSCHHCTHPHTSKAEIELRHRLSKDSELVILPFTQATIPGMYFESGRGITVDILGYSQVLQKKVAIEYDGGWHSKEDVLIRDTYKTTALLASGYAVIRVRCTKLDFLPMEHELLFQVHQKQDWKTNSLEPVVRDIQHWIYKKEVSNG